MAGYAGVPFEQQLAIMQATVPLAALATESASMWTQAKGELTKSAGSLQQNLKQLESAWLDHAGEACQTRGRQSCNDITSWTQKIDGTVAELTALAALITKTAGDFERLAARLTEATNAAELVQLLLQLQREGGALLDALAARFQQTAGTMSGAKGNPWSGPSGASGAAAGGPTGGGAGGGAGGLAEGRQMASASAGGDSGPSAASSASASGAGASASAGALDENGMLQQDLAGNPTLQGLESSVLPPQPTLPQLPQPVATPTSQSVLPLIPPLGLTGAGAGGGAGGVRSAGGLRGGAAIPGVRLGGGPKSIPQAAAPISAEAAAATSGRGPANPPGPTTPPPGGTSTTGGVPPMSPMMGGLGAGGSGGVPPGPGTAQRAASGRGAKPTPTPGLPVSLRGKAGRADRLAFSPLSRPSRREPEEDLATVQRLDEELWQVDDAPAEIRGERPAPARRRAH